MKNMMVKLVVAAVSAAMCFGTFGDESWNFNGKFWNYVLEDGKATITGVDLPSGNLELPATVGSDNYPVVAVGDSAFSGSDGLEAVILPASVKKIGYDAFGRCSNLRSVNLGSVEDIGGEAFIYCEELMAVVIPNSTTNIAGSAFAGCVRLSDVTIGSGVAKIGEATIPHYYDATYDYWTTVDFDPAFGGCDSLENFKLAEGNAKYELIGGCLYYRATPNNAKTLAVYPSGRAAFTLSGDVTVTAIGEGACSGCNKLTDLTIPSSVRNIGIEAFAHCGDLASVIIPANSVTNIEFGAFAWNMDVMNVEVAGCVKNIGEWAFMHCFNAGVYSGKVGHLVLQEGIESIGKEAFHRCFCIGEIVIPNSVTSLGEGAFGANRFVRRIVIGSGLDRISDYAFQSDWGSMLSKLEIGPNVETIGDYAFSGCEKLRTLNIPEGVTEIGDYAFSDCRSLCSLNLPGSLRRIGIGAFGSYFYSFTAARKGKRALLGTGTTFGGCDELRRVLLPLGVENVGSNAFSSVVSANLDKIYLPASLKSSSDAETEAYLDGLFPTMNLGVGDVEWYDDAGDLNYVTVTFDPNNGGAATSVQVLDYVDSLPVPSYAGHAFAGWWTKSDDSGYEVSMYDQFVANMTCYAHWIETPVTFGEDEPWTAVYDDDLDEMVLESGDIAFGETSSASMSVAGPCIVTFSYLNYMSDWGTSNDLTLLVDGEEVDYYGISEGWTVVTNELAESGAHTVTWRYDNLNGSYDDYARLFDISVTPAEAHTLTFHTEGGTMSAPSSRQVISSPGKLPVPTKSGVIFAGWYTAANGGERFTSNDTVDGNLDLYAHWTSAPFTIGGDGTWYVDEDGSYRSTAIARGQTLYAERRFTGPCRISFDWKVHVDSGSDDGVVLYIDGEYKGAIGGDMDYWEDFEEDVEGEGEHVFRWVFLRPDYGDNDPTMLNCAWLNNIFIGTVCAITFDENYEGGQVNTRNLAGTLGELPVPKRSGYVVFTGWYTLPEGGVQVAPDTPVTVAATYYAHWRAVPFIFEDEPWVEQSDGSWMSPDGLDNYNSNDVVKEFEGPCTVTFRWKFEATGYFYPKSTFTVYDENFNELVETNASSVGWVDETVTFDTEGVHMLRFRYYSGRTYGDGVSRAYIKDVSSTPLATYDVTFAANYVGGTNITRKVVQQSAIGNLPAPWRTGFIQTGWWTAASGGTRIATDTVVSADVVYYAQWEATDFEFSGDAPWSLDQDGAYRTGKIGYGQDSDATLTVEGPCTVSFKWKMSSTDGAYFRYSDNGYSTGYDYIDCLATEWATKSYTVDGGTHVLKWHFYKNQYSADGEALMKDLVVTPLASYTVTFNPNYAGGTNTTRKVLQNGTLGEPPSVFRSGYAFTGWFTAAEGGTQVTAATVVNADMTVYAHWIEATSFDSTGGNADWTVEADGSWRSGTITHNQNSWAQVTVSGPCEVSFKWKVSSESGYDYLTFTVDGDTNTQISGTGSDWETRLLSISDSGSHVLKWTYSKDGSASNGSDCGWVKDLVVVTPEPPAPPVTVDDTKMEGPVENVDGTRTIAAKDGVALTQSDVASVTIASPSDPTVDITAAYKRELDSANNQIVVTLSAPAITAVDAADKDDDDATGLIEDVSKVDNAKIAELPTPDTSDPTNPEEVGALPVRMYKGLWYQASWGDDLNALTPGTKFQADGTQTHIGVIKQKGSRGFYKLNVSEK